MAELLSSMPQMPLQFGFTMTFEAISPTTGAAVAGVTVSTAQIYALEAKGESLVDETPRLTPEELFGSLG